MPFQLVLTLEYRDDTHWRWVLSDADGRFLEDQEVALDAADPTYEIFKDLPRQLRFNENVRPAEDILAELGKWMGEKVFGRVGEKLLAYERAPACVVRVRVPPEAQNLLFRPFELAHLGGKPLAERALRLIYTVAHEPGRTPGRSAPKEIDAPDVLRVLGVFSLPRDATPLNLRQERYRLQQLVRDFVRKGNRAVELRLLQYGATRQLLTEVLEEAPGWDVMHFSGHGLEGELILEKPDGTADQIDAEELAELLRPAGARLKLLTLSACYSGAADLRAARAQIGLDNPPPTHQPDAPAQTKSVLPSLGQRLAEELDCAVLAMRYPVLDDFAAELVLTLYDRLLEKKQPLPQALQLALDDALDASHNPQRPTFSRLTPLLFGARAADLRLQAPTRPHTSFALPETGLSHFLKEPERFVGRLLPMLNASQALAPQSGKTGVLFHGMAGAGKTSCALELAYRYDPQNVERFTAFVWHKAPEENHDIVAALTQFALSLENQLPGLELVGLMDDPQKFQRLALPRLRALLESRSILLVLDNLEGLLTARGEWRDPRWGDLLRALLDHNGISRLVLTSRRLPTSLANDPRLQIDAIHALSFTESVILARQLPHLKKLFDDAPGHVKLRRILLAAQGHPKLLELADATAATPAALDTQLTRAETAGTGANTTRMAFFERGQSDQPEDVFLNELRRWTDSVAQNLAPTARLLAQFLARLEDTDRTLDVVQANWSDFLKRLTGERAENKQPAPEPALSQAQAALSEPTLGLEVALQQLSQSGLIEIETITSQELQLTNESLQTLVPIVAAQNPEVAALLNNPQGVNQQDLLPHLQAALVNSTDPALQAWLNEQQSNSTSQQFRLHPGVAETLLLSALPSVINAVDIELGDYFIVVFQHGIKTEMQGGGRLVVEGARHAVPYLLWTQRWEEAAFLLEKMIHRDTSPTTIALAIPLLRQIAEKTEGTATSLENAGVLANALLSAGRYAEVEQIERDRIARCVLQGDYRTASMASGNLFNLLLRTARFKEALQTAEEKAAYDRRAGLGQWTQLGTEGRRLQALNALGHYSEVLEALEQHRERMKDMPEEITEVETINPWKVREVLLDIGRDAAMYLEQWETVLALNAENVHNLRQRDADEMEIARTRFNEYTALLRLGRYSEARHLLEYCRTIFDLEGAVFELSAVYSALADLEDEEGRPASAVRFEQTALRYTYQAGRPEDCSISHNNLAKYFGSAGGASDAVLAHRMASGLICVQISSGLLSRIIRNLTISTLPSSPPSFAQVCAIVEQIEGVRFRELFAQLPQRTPDGDAAIQALWEMVQDEIARISVDNTQQSQKTPQDFEPLLQSIAEVARGNSEQQANIEEVLVKMEEDGWQLASAVQRIWAGEREAETLTVGIDPNSAALVRRVLELVKTPAGE
jgi:tetratricopeptide (TPR) repeat protein